MSNESLPSTRVLLTRIFNNLSTFPPSPPNPTTSTATAIPPATSPESYNNNHDHVADRPLLPPAAKPLLLTLHSLLPHCLLPALDLFDCGLIERWIPKGLDPTSPTTKNPLTWVYYITSKPASPISSESTNPFRSNTSSPSPNTYTYEVRPSIWHCTCANFTLYAFASAAEPATIHDSVEEQVDDKTTWIWGSQYLSPSHPSAIPVCKHLLAAVLAEQCPALFGAFVKEKRDVLKEEMAEKACWWD
ncbi:hypothetical protein L211DRAFT_299242 [Terfezia boudieri ATCC MYA-4762]|uniref:SWIM-type domain-containing protein n=1 Tax=Terfezia boudieri ATCC MYA-4762 TaxID=1051890 RepID=A0A3N4LJQ2_9PEZI|nr:hypothetical protein L211DRAFT_299242 [Terfezia boudieri ATCC MYA-4762]